MNTLLRHTAGLVCALFVAAHCAHAAPSAIGRRVALIIGNAKYEHADVLANTVNDADAVAALLTKAGFEVVDERRNVGVVEFKRAVREFMMSANNADIAVVYYSGHGIEVGGINYLIPVDAKLASDYDIDDEAISLDRLTLATQPAKRLRLIILDACRDNPFLRSGDHPAATRGVANRLMGVQPTGTDTLIAYAAKAGSSSFDGIGPNSPFTTALVKYLAEPGVDIRIALGKVRDDVLAATGNQQEPFVYGSLGGDNVSLVPAPAAAAVEAAPAVDPNAAAALDYELAERVGARQAWESFLTVHKSGFYAELARAQLAKLTAAPLAKSPDPDKAAKEQADRVAELQRQEKERRAPAPAPVPPPAPAIKPEREAAVQPRADGTSARLAPDQACKRDEARLARLRVDASLEQVAQFASELGCEDLRPQVQRLMESLGAKPVAALQAPAAAPSPQSEAVARVEEPPCKRDEARLARLRVDPSLGQATQFARELACEELRPQVQRLIESLGGEPVVADRSASDAAASQSRGFASDGEPAPGKTGAPAPGQADAAPLDAAQICKRESEELARIRAHLERESAIRFAKNVKCEDLRPQAARLLESLAD
jgi:uncharacterized caspase-like protein